MIIGAWVFERLGSANRVLDVVVLIFLIVLLMSRKPILLVAVVVLYIVPFLLPLESVARWAEAQQSAETAAKTSDSPALSRQEAMDQVTAATQVMRDVAGTLDANGRDVQVKEATPGAGRWSAESDQEKKRSKLLPTRHEEMVIEALWFYARLTFLFAVAPLIYVDVTVMLIGLGLMLIPIPYFVVLSRITSPVIFGERVNAMLAAWMQRPGEALGALMQSSWGPIFLMGLGVMVGGFLFWWNHQHQAQFVEFIKPDPQKDWVKINGRNHTFRIFNGILEVEGLRLEMKRAHPDSQNPRRWRFSTGTEVEFIPRETEKIDP
jgi:hypothetical protein